MKSMVYYNAFEKKRLISTFSRLHAAPLKEQTIFKFVVLPIPEQFRIACIL